MATKRLGWGRVRQLPSGRWQARYPGPDDVLRPAPDTFERRRDAEDWLANKRTEILKGEWIDPDAGTITLADYGDKVLSEARVAETTRERDEIAFRVHVKPFLGGKAIGEIKLHHIRTWRKEREDAGTGQPSIAKAYRVMRKIFNTAIADELIKQNPCRIPGADQDGSPERVVLTIGEVFAVADAIQPRYRALVLLAAFSSLRFGELAALQRKHLDMNEIEVLVRQSQAELANGRRFVKEPKSAAGVREVAIPKIILNDLKHHLATYAEKGSNGVVFIGPRGGKLSRRNFRRIWLKALADSKITKTGVHFHDLRHTGNDLAAKAGASTKELMSRMGHATMQAALIYQHDSRERDRAIADAMDLSVRRARRKTKGTKKPKGHAKGTRKKKAS